MDTNQSQKIDDLGSAMSSLHQSVQGLVATASSKLDLSDLRVELADLNARAVKLAKEQQILGSLRFKAMLARVSKIQDAHGDTFSWIFDRECDAGFGDWLRNDQGVYWISGKPGSGKSTLMKYLYNDQRTREALHNWAEDSKLVTAGFFFWSVGTSMQKSQEGLFRSLLFEILKQCPELIATACPDRWTSENQGTMEQQDWDLTELSEVISRLFTNFPASTKFCFFIDGLDEYDGHHRDVIKILNSLVSSSRFVKICVSSRPWNVFEDAYGRDNSKKLYLEDLTRGDIESYVRNKLEDHTAVALYSIEEEGYDDLILEIVNKAEGVFLWVYLVVHSLCEGLINGDDVQLLQERVRQLPSDLEHYFRLIIESVEVEYRKNMARTFQVALQATEPLTLIAHSFLDERDPEYAIKAEIKAFDDNDIFVRHEKTKRRIRGRYKNLLHVSKEEAAINFLGYRVDFFHRTVHDFLRLKEIQVLLLSYLTPEKQQPIRKLGFVVDRVYGGPRFGERFRDPQQQSQEPRSPKQPFNSNIALCKIYLALMKSMPWDKSKSTRRGIFQEFLDTFLYHARQAEAETDQSSHELLDELETTILNLSNSNPHILWDRTTSDEYKKNKTFLELVIRSGLCRYVEELLKYEPYHIRNAPRSLLNSALHFSPSLAEQESEMPGMVRFLLKEGVNPNEWDGESTVFGNYIHSISYNKDGAPRLSTIPSVILQRHEVLDLLLSHKADPNTTFLKSRPRFELRATAFRPSEGVTAWGQLVMSMHRIQVSRSVIQAYIDILKMLFRHGADPNLMFDDVRQETIWGSFLRSMYVTKTDVGTEGRMRLRYEMTKAFLHNGADLDIHLDFPGAPNMLLSDIIAQVFSPADRASLEEIMNLDHRYKVRYRYCCVDKRHFTWIYTTVNDSISQISTSLKTKLDLRQSAGSIMFQDDQGDEDLVFKIDAPNTSTLEQSQLLSCTIVLNNDKCKLRIPESAVFCSYRCGKVPGDVNIRITTRYDDSDFGVIEFSTRNVEELYAEIEARDRQGWSTIKATGTANDKDIQDESTTNISSSSPSSSTQWRKRGHMLFHVRPRPKPDLKLNQPAQTKHPGGSEYRAWLIHKLRSRNLSELSETLEILLYALNEASEIDLRIDLPKDTDIEMFAEFMKAVSSQPDTD